MLYLIHGQNDFFSKRFLKELVANKEVEKVLPEKAEVFFNNIRTISFFNTEKFFIFEEWLDYFSFQKIQEQKEIYNHPICHFVFFERKEIKDKKKIVFFQENGKVYYFAPLSFQKMRQWIREEFQKKGFTIGKEAIEELIFLTNGNAWQISREIEKLISFAKNKKTIQAEDIEKIVPQNPELNIFDTIEAIASLNKKKALERLYLHLQKGESALYLFSMVQFQFRNILLFKKDKNSVSGFHPYFLRRIQKLATHFNAKRLEKIYHKLFQIDLQIKTGRLSPRAGLEFLILDL